MITFFKLNGIFLSHNTTVWIFMKLMKPGKILRTGWSWRVALKWQLLFPTLYRRRNSKAWRTFWLRKTSLSTTRRAPSSRLSRRKTTSFASRRYSGPSCSLAETSPASHRPSAALTALQVTQLTCRLLIDWLKTVLESYFHSIWKRTQ